VLISHDLNLARGSATHALLLNGDRQWQAGPVEQVMDAANLSRCLGYPIEAVRHGGRTFYVPAQQGNV
jgi:iron complex transport system ATP-binding protein